MGNIVNKILGKASAVHANAESFLPPDTLKWMVLQVVQPGFDIQTLPALMEQHPLPQNIPGAEKSWEVELIIACSELDADEKAYMVENPEVADKVVQGRMTSVDDISTLIMHDRDTIRGPRNFAKAVDALDGKGTQGKVSAEEQKGNLHPLDTPEEAYRRAREAAAIRDAEFLAKHPYPPKPVRAATPPPAEPDVKPET